MNQRFFDLKSHAASYAGASVAVPRRLDLQPLPQYRAERSHVFPSDESLRWFCRKNKSELIERGALVAPTGRQMAQPAEFDRAVVEIGGRMAACLGRAAK